jgi:hypothetical protein
MLADATRAPGSERYVAIVILLAPRPSPARLLGVAAALAAVVCLGGCPSSPGGFGGAGAPQVLALLPDAAVLVPYEGSVALDGGEAASFSLASGALPPGLALAEDGRITGTPSWLGAWAFEVVGRLSSGDEIRGAGSIDVIEGDTAVFPGFPRSPHPSPSGALLLGDLWMRIAGGGEPGQDALRFEPGLYVPGPDGVADGGGGDDVRVLTLTWGLDASLALGQWSPSNPGDDDDPPTWDEASATFRAGVQAGRRSLSLSALDHPPLSLFLAVVPPDWCPRGEHPAGGPSPGVCE